MRFFAASLDGADNGFFDEPRLISYMQEPVAPAGSYDERAGRWVADPSWPSPAVDAWTHTLGGDALHEPEEPQAGRGGTQSARASGHRRRRRRLVR